MASPAVSDRAEAKRLPKMSERAMLAAESAGQQPTSAALQTDGGHAHALASCLAQLRRDHPQSCDLALVGTDGRAVAVHRSVVEALAPSLAVAGAATVSLSGASGPTVQALVDYMYSGELSLSGDNVLELMKTAADIGLRGAAALCGRFLATSLDTDNVLRLWVKSYGVDGLGDRALELIDRHFDAIASGPDWLTLSAAQVGVLLRRDSLQVASEHAVMQALRAWMAAAREERLQDYLGMFLEPALVRIPYLTPQQLGALDDDEDLSMDAGAIYRIHGEFRRRVLGEEAPVAPRAGKPRSRASGKAPSSAAGKGKRARG